MKKYTVKYWKTKEDYDKGEATFLRDDYTESEGIQTTSAIISDVYAVEMFETVSGETYFHSKE